MIELLGFAGSILIIVSLTMKSIVRLRVIGVLGALVFIAYGCWLQAWPVVATNTVTFSIHIYQLRILAMEGRLQIAGRDLAGFSPQDPRTRTLESSQGGEPAPVGG